MSDYCDLKIHRDLNCDLSGQSNWRRRLNVLSPDKSGSRPGFQFKRHKHQWKIYRRCFFITEITGTNDGYVRTVKSILGNLPLSQKQGSVLGVKTGKRISPYLELCCLRISANVSYADAASDVAMLTGIEVSSKTQQRLVQAYDFSQPKADTPIQEACVDGGKVRLRTPLDQECVWRDYKAIATDQGTVANFQRNPSLIDWINQQPLSLPLTCLGDGHDGVWNLIAEIATPTQRREILDWYHLNENLQKVGGSLKRLRQAEARLWSGQVDETIALFGQMNRKQAKNFCLYLEKHRHRIINYAYYQAEGICSIGSGAVESAIKQIDRRVQISWAQWKAENVPQVLAHRTAYLNGLFSLKG